MTDGFTARSAPSRREPLLTFLVATAAASALYWTGRAVPVVRENLHGAIAVIFLYAPTAAARLTRRPFDSAAAGLRADPLGANAATLALTVALVFPLFLLGFWGFYTLVCSPDAPTVVRGAAELVAPVCPRWQGWRGAALRLPDGFALLALTQLLVIALPEEYFFRAYLWSRLEPPPDRSGRRLLGPPLVLTSALFALGHVLVDFDPQRLAVFFPGLIFGWMRARTGSIAAGTVFHALCNLLSQVLHDSFFLPLPR